LKIDNLEVEEYIPLEDYPTECSYHPIFNEAMANPDRKDFWFNLYLSWILAGFQWYRWN